MSEPTDHFRAELFHVLNFPEFYNPTRPAGAGLNDPTAPVASGCDRNTPDQAPFFRQGCAIFISFIAQGLEVVTSFTVNQAP
jgi:hypothetical protein